MEQRLLFEPPLLLLMVEHFSAPGELLLKIDERFVCLWAPPHGDHIAACEFPPLHEKDRGEADVDLSSREEGSEGALAHFHLIFK